MRVLALVVLCVLSGGLAITAENLSAHSIVPRNDVAARAAFSEAYKVFMSPRCMNCHPAGNSPLQGDDSHPHFDRVRRGEDGSGVYSMKCGNCHQAANQAGMNLPPGAPNVLSEGSLDYSTPRWRLPSAKTPMIFQGRTAAQLCVQLKDTKQNGGLTAEQLIHHVSNDPLVLWGWNPGEGRTTPPLTHDQFVANVKEWIEAGGACPR